MAMRHCLRPAGVPVLTLLAAALAATTATTHAGGAGSAISEPVTVAASSAPRQSFDGFGFSLVREMGTRQSPSLMANFSAAQREKILSLICEDLGATVVRLWWTPDEGLPLMPSRGSGNDEFMQSYVDSGLAAALRRHGVKQLLLAPDRPCIMGAENATAGGHNITLRAAETAGFIAQLKQRGVTIDASGVANEPGCWEKWQNASGTTIDASWPSVPDASGNILHAVTALTAGLATAGMHRVKIIAPESSNADNHALAEVHACQADTACWAALDGIATHSYGMAATEAFAKVSVQSMQSARALQIPEP